MPLKFSDKDVEYKLERIPVPETCINGVCCDPDINVNGRHVAIIHRLKNGCKIEGEDEKFVNVIGDVVMLWYESSSVHCLLHIIVSTQFPKLRIFFLINFSYYFHFIFHRKIFLPNSKSFCCLQ